MGWAAAYEGYDEYQNAINSSDIVYERLSYPAQFEKFAREEPGAVIPTQGIKLIVKDQIVYFLNTKTYAYHYAYAKEKMGETR